MKIELNEIELGYLNELIELEQANNLNTDPKNKNNIMVNELVKKLTIPDVSDSDLINQIKKCKDEMIEDMEMCGYTMEAPLIKSLVDLIKLINKL